MALAVVQIKQGVASLVSTLTVTLDNPTTTGNLLVVDIGVYTDLSTFSAINDNATGNNSWSVSRSATSDVSSHSQIVQYYAKNITGHAAEAIVVTTGAPTYYVVSVIEISGADASSPLDVGGNDVSAGVMSHVNSTSAPTTVANTIAVAFGCDMQAIPTVTEDAAWTAQNVDGSISRTVQATEIFSATGVKSRTFTSGTNASFNMHMAAYKISSGAPPLLIDVAD